jgi:hypothetical protein
VNACVVLRVVIIAWFALLSTSNCYSDSSTSDIPSLRSFFPLTEEAARSLATSAGLDGRSLRSGLYYSNPQLTRFQVDIGTSLEEAFVFDAGYLVHQKQILDIYGDRGWRVRETRRFVPGSNPPVEDSHFHEFRWKAGWVRAIDENGEGVRQLWIVAPTGMRWLLYEKGRNTKSHFFCDLPKFLLPVENGVFLVAQDWVPTLLFISGEPQTRFPWISYDLEEQPATSFLAARRFAESPYGEDRLFPLAAYDAATRSVAFAGWKTPVEGLLQKTAPLTKEVSTDIFILDVGTRKIDHVAKDVPWDFALESVGIFTRDQGLSLMRFNWQRKSLGKAEPIALSPSFRPNFKARPFRSEGYTPQYRRVFESYRSTGTAVRSLPPLPPTRPEKDELYQLELLGKPVDRLKRVLTGDTENQDIFWNDARFNDEMNDRFGGTLERATKKDEAARTFLVVTYESDEEPTGFLDGYLLNLEEGLVEVPRYLRNLAHVFEFGTTFPNLDSKLTKIRDATLGRNSLLYLPEFPTTLADPTRANLEAAANRFKLLNETFYECSKLAQCLVVVNVRKEMWNALRRAYPALTKDVRAFPLPVPATLDERRNVARAMLHRAIGKKSLSMSEPSFQTLFAVMEEMRATDRERSGNIVHFYKTFIDGLVKHVGPQAVASPSREIDLALVENYRRYANKEFGHWKIMELPMTEEEVRNSRDPLAKVGAVTPYWVAPDGQSKHALPPTFLRLWRTDKDKFIKNDSYSHAVFYGRLPGSAAEDLILLRPETKAETYRILKERLVDHVQLHPDGLFVVYEDKGTDGVDRLSLFFFQINFSFPGLPNQEPGTVRLLANDLSQSSFLARRMRFEYVDGKLHVIVGRDVRVFGPWGEEVSDVP